MWTKLVNYLGNLLIKTFPKRAKLIEVEGKPYITRFYIKHNGRLPGIYLHHFHQSDPDRDLHNHPWAWAFSLILTGGYNELRFEQSEGLLAHLEPTVYDRKAPGYNFIKGDTFHRILLKDLRRGAWTIFVSGPDVKDWGFMTAAGFVEHTKYLGLVQPFEDKP